MGVNFATYEALVDSIAHVSDLRKLRQVHSLPAVPRLGPKQKVEKSARWEERISKWVVPFLGADSAIIRLGQAITTKDSDQKPPQVAVYFACENFLGLLGLGWFGFWIQLLAPLSWGKRILLRFPGIFSFGVFRRGGPSDDQIKQARFKSTFFAKGYSTLSLAEKGGAPDLSAKYSVSGFVTPG